MLSLLRITLTVPFLLALTSRVDAQSWLSAGLAVSVPAANGGGNHVMATLELGPARFPVRLRADLAAIDYAPFGPRFAQMNANLLVPFIQRPVSPYFVAGVAFAPTSRLGSRSTGGEGLRAGVGLRYRVAERVLFIENVQHWGLTRSLLTFGVQF